MASHTPGPWGWFGNNHGIYLATRRSGRRTVMDFVRMGMRGAQPRFCVSSIMYKAAELVRFAVGDGRARGFEQGKADRTVYRFDISEIDHPDARLIAMAPELLSALEDMAEAARNEVGQRASPSLTEALSEADRVIATSKGVPQSWPNT